MKEKFDLNAIPNIQIFFRVVGFLIFFGFLLGRLWVMKQYGGDTLYRVSPPTFYAYRLLWFLESVIYLFYMSAYLFRLPASRMGKGFWETIFPLITAALPFLMIRNGIIELFFPGSTGKFQDLTRLSWGGKSMYIVQVEISYIPLLIAISVMLVGTIISIIALSSLWRCFSIMVEVRDLIKTGIYKYIRHPLYLGEMISYLGVLMLRFSYENLLIYIVFIFCIILRSQIEEKKLEESFPDYAKYKERTGMFFPTKFIRKIFGWNFFS